MTFRLHVTRLDELPLAERIKLGFKHDANGIPIGRFDDGYVEPTFEIRSILDLKLFVEKYRQVVIRDVVDENPILEIYNDWRE